MTPLISRSFAAAILTLATVAHAQSTGSSSSSTTTSTTTTTSPSTATTSRTTTQASPTTTTTPTTTAPRAPNTVTQPVPAPANPRLTPPTGPVAPVDPLSVPADATRARPANAASAVTGVPPGSTNASIRLDANGNPIAVSGASLDALAAAGVDVALDPTATLAAVRRTPFADARTTIEQVRTRVEATGRALTELRAQARANGVATAGSNFDQVAAEIRTREDLLRDALREAGTATSEEAWRQAQHQVTTHYQAYADAVRRAQQLLQIPQQ